MLKKAQKWHKQFRMDEIGVPGQNYVGISIAEIEKIQLNAMQHALQLAAKLVHSHNAEAPTYAEEQLMDDIEQAILTISKSLTSDKLNQ